MRHQPIPSIQVVIQPSYLLLGWYLLVSIAVLFSLTYLPSTVTVKWLASGVVVMFTVYSVLRDALLVLPWSLHALWVRATGEVELITKQQQVYRVDMLPSSVCHPFLVVMHFNRLGQSAGFQSTLYLTPFRVENSDQLRRLRVWMRWAAKPALNKQPYLDQGNSLNG